MPDESFADDQALYGIWDHLTAEQVRAVLLLLYELFRLKVKRGGAVPTPEMIALAEQLRDGDPPLGHLPIVQEMIP